MIVIGTDTHKRTHTCAAVDGLTAAARGELTVAARQGSFGKLLGWARQLDTERVWAMYMIRLEPAFFGLRRNPRFAALVRRMHFGA